MIKTKKQMYALIGSFILVILLGTVTYAFFNYTRTGTANTIRTGRIAFNTSQSGTFNITNVFPITRVEAATDNTNSSEVIITVTGDTTYTDGMEYLITVEDVVIETSTYKKVPIGITVTAEKTGELGTENANYFNTTGGRGGNTSYYKALNSNILKDGDYILVGYIRPGVQEVNGTIGIRAFIDKDKILISDTYDGTESDNMGTTNSQAEGKTVLTTTEWNSLQGNNAISFKVKVQANEGIWVGEPLSRNDMKSISGTTVFTNDQKSAITEINFIRMSEEMINIHADLIDLKATGGNGVVKGWIENNKLYIASPGETYFPQDSLGLFSGFINATRMNFNNVNTSLVQNMSYMFDGDYSLLIIDLSNFDTSNVTNMSGLFFNCAGLEDIDISYLDTSSVTNMSLLFGGATNLEKVNISGLGSNYLSNASSMFSGDTSMNIIDMSDFDFGNVTSLSSFFGGAISATSINLENADTSSVTDMSNMFNGCSDLQNVNLSGIDTSNVTNMTSMFYHCLSLETLDLSSFDTSSLQTAYIMFGMTNWNSTDGYTPVENALTTIYVGNNWDLTDVTGSNDMFYNCTHLVGGSGTVFDSNYIDKTRAIVDGGSSNPGYLTLKTN